MLVYNICFNCGGTGESGTLLSVGDWITLFGVQPVVFKVARPTCATCKRTSRRRTIGWQGRPNNHVFDIGTSAIRNHGDVWDCLLTFF